MLEEKIHEDYKAAMKSRDSFKSSVLSFLRAEILNTAVAKKKNRLDDAEVIAVVKKQVKQHEDSIEQFRKGQREEMADKEAQELRILQDYLPPELSGEELRKIVEDAIVEAGASGLKDMGSVMKIATGKAAGADGKKLSELVRQRLTGKSALD